MFNGPQFKYADTLQLDMTTVHPSLREDMTKEIAYLNKTYPLFNGSTIGVMVSATYCPEDPNDCHVWQRKAMEGTGLTNMSVKDRRFSITLSESEFGLSANTNDIKTSLIDDMAKRFHGSMINQAYVLTHEYGHVIFGMIKMALMFDDGGTFVNDPDATAVRYEVKSFIKYWYRNMNQLDLIMLDLMGVAPELNMNNANRLVSGYAMVSPDEYFAETFAALCWSTDPEDLKLPSVIAISKLLKTVYAFIRSKEPINELQRQA